MENKMSAFENAMEDYMTIASWYSESRTKEQIEACDELYKWFCSTDNKGTLAFQIISQKGG